MSDQISTPESDYQLAIKMSDWGKYDEAFKLFAKNKNHPCSVFMLGYLYSEGKGVKKDNIKAMELYLKNINMKGNQCRRDAYNNLGLLYEEFKDHGLAIFYLKKSVAMRNHTSRLFLARAEAAAGDLASAENNLKKFLRTNKDSKFKPVVDALIAQIKSKK